MLNNLLVHSVNPPFAGRVLLLFQSEFHRFGIASALAFCAYYPQKRWYRSLLGLPHYQIFFLMNVDTGFSIYDR